MRTLLNIIWFVFGGLPLLRPGRSALLHPHRHHWGRRLRMARYALAVRAAVVGKEGAGAGAVVLNVVWIVLAGWWLPSCTCGGRAGDHVIGIPLAIAN